MISFHHAIQSLHVAGDTVTVIRPLKCHIKMFGTITIIATLKVWISVSHRPLWSYCGSHMPLYRPAGQAWTLPIIEFIKQVQSEQTDPWTSPELLAHKTQITMSTESEVSVQLDGQPEALLERVLVLEQSLNIQGPQQSGPRAPRQGRQGPPHYPWALPTPVATAVSIDCPSWPPMSA